jgi:hypothetical protein
MAAGAAVLLAAGFHYHAFVSSCMYTEEDGYGEKGKFCRLPGKLDPPS